MRSEDLAAGLDDGRLLLADSVERFPVPHDVDDSRIQTHRDRFHLMERPLVRLVMFAGRRQDRQFRQRAPERRIPPDSRS